MQKKDYKHFNALVKKAIEGDHKAFEQLCEKVAQRVLYSCIKIMGSTEDGEDASQEVFINMQRTLHSLRSPEAFNSWLQKISMNVCIRMRQDIMKQPTSFLLEDFADLFTETDDKAIPEEYIVKKEKREELSHIIDGLPDQTRICVIMYYFNDLKVAEIAEILKLSDGTVKTHLYLGREKIRAAIQKLEKKSNKKVYLHAGTLLPMAALSTFFEQDMQHMVKMASINHVLKPLNIRVSTLARLSTTAKIASIAIGGGVILTLSAIAYNVASKPAMPPGSISQHIVDVSSVAGFEDPSQDAGNGELSASYLSEKGNLSSATGVSNPVGEAQLYGKVVLQNVQTEGDIFNDQYYVTLEKEGAEIVSAKVDNSGNFYFSSIKVPSQGKYTLRLHCTSTVSPVFLEDNPEGTMQIVLSPGDIVHIEKAFTIIDNSYPVVKIAMKQSNGTNTSRNPEIAEIIVDDATNVSLAWEISSADGKLAAEGNGNNIPKEVFDKLAAGEYNLKAISMDAAGNKSMYSKVFYVA